MKKIILISLLTSSLFAEQKSDISDFFIDQDLQKVTNESAFGKANTYSLLYAKHQLMSEDENLHFYYGAKVGVLQEEYTKANGFGIPLNKIGAYYAAAIGMKYDLSTKAMLLAEGSRSEDLVHDHFESKMQVTYTYNY